jgi:hypothetical protein
MDRRTFLKRGAIGGALLALGVGGLAVWPSRMVAPPTRALRSLDARAFQVLIAVARRIVSVPGADAVEIAHRVDETFAHAAPETRHDFGALLGLLEAALPGAVLDFRLGPFTTLSPSSQDAVLKTWRDSSIALRRSGFEVLRKLCLGAHYGDPATWAGIDYPAPPPVKRGMIDDSKAGTPEWIAAQAAAKEATP